MEELILDTVEAPLVVVEKVGGDLRLTGWDQNQVQAISADDHTLSLTLGRNPGEVQVSAEADCNLHVPRAASLRLIRAGGDARLKNVEGNLDIIFVGGDLVLRQVGPAVVGAVGGDLSAKKVNGGFSFSAGGDVSARGVAGELQGKAGADLFLRDVEGGVRVVAGSDAVLSTGFKSGQVYEIKAGSDVLCRVPPGTSAKFEIRCGSDIAVDVLGAQIEGGARNKVVTLGDGTAQVSLSAGSDVTLATQAYDQETLGEFGDSFGRDFGVMAEEFAAQFSQMESQMADLEQQLNERLGKEEFPGVPGFKGDELATRIRAEVERALATARRQSANVRTRMEAKMDAAEQRAERLAEKNERQGDKRRKTGAFVFKFDAPRPPVPPKPPVPPVPPMPPTTVSDEERMAVLTMLEKGTITVEQAEKLLAALEGTNK